MGFELNKIKRRHKEIMGEVEDIYQAEDARRKLDYARKTMIELKNAPKTPCAKEKMEYCRKLAQEAQKELDRINRKRR